MLILQLYAFISRTEALGESISKTFVNSINAQSNKIKTEFVKPQKSQCRDGSMSLKDKSSHINLKCEEENSHDETRSCPKFLKYERKHEKLMPSLKCEGNGIYNDLSPETKSLKYERKQIIHKEDGINGEGFEPASDGLDIKADKAVDNENTNASANAEDANSKDATVKDANAKDDKTTNADINEKAPDEDVENQFMKLLKIINIESRKVGPIKLTSRWKSLEKLISVVVYTAGHITGYSVNMVRWAGRASMVIMNQEEKVLNTDTSKDGNYNNYAVLDSPVAGSKLYKFVLLAEAVVVKLVDNSEGGGKLYRFRVFNLMVANLVKLSELLIKIWTIEFKKSL